MATVNTENFTTSQGNVLRRVLFLGPSGAGKSKMINSCFNRDVDKAMLETPAGVSASDRIIGTTSSISNYVDQRNKIVYVDTVGYGDVRFHQDQQAFLLFFRELICYSSIGFNWIFLFIRYSQMSQDTLVYLQSLEGLLGKNAFERCTIVFTNCKQANMTLERCIEANKEHTEIVGILQKIDSDDDPDTQLAHQLLLKAQHKKRLNFLVQMLMQIDRIDEKTLILEKDWYTYYKTRFTRYIGYLWEKVVGRPNELSKLYKLSIGMKKDIPLTIYYEECSICRDLIIEIVEHSPKACITKCGHIFHYDCLKKTFDHDKKCPDCRADLRTLPERVAGFVIGLKQVQDPLKSNVE